MKDAGGRKLVLDACVLIDYFKEDREVLRAAARSLGRLLYHRLCYLKCKRRQHPIARTLALLFFRPSFGLSLPRQNAGADCPYRTEYVCSSPTNSRLLSTATTSP